MIDTKEIAKTIAHRVRAIRKSSKLSLQEIADSAGITKSHVWEIEQGRSKNPTITTAVGLANALGISLDYLIGLSSNFPNLHPDALRIGCEIDVLLKRAERISEQAQIPDAMLTERSKTNAE